MKKKERRSEETGSQWLNMMCEVLKGGVAAGVVTILALLLCAVLVSVGVVPVNAMYGCVLGTLAGGTYAVQRIGNRSLLVGLSVGTVLFLLLLTAGLIAYEGATVANRGVGILCACLCGGAISGLLARKPKKKRRR